VPGRNADCQQARRRRLRRSRLATAEIAACWVDRIPAAQSLDVRFHEFMADDARPRARRPARERRGRGRRSIAS
jgi:hypothetical protein